VTSPAVTPAADAGELAWVCSGGRYGEHLDCVQVAGIPGGGVALRRAGDRDSAGFRFTREQWAMFRAALDRGDFNFLWPPD
jgi:hypothetical protein